MSARIGRIDFALVFGLGFGLYSFFKGLRIYREYRVIEDTPEMPVRSIAMGLVAVRGRAVGEPPVTSPISRTPCYFYKVEIEKWQSNSRSGGGTWHHYAAGTGGGEFYLEDATGKVLVDARQAELDLVCVEEREVDGTTGLFYSTMPVIASDSALDAALGSSDEQTAPDDQIIFSQPPIFAGRTAALVEDVRERLSTGWSVAVASDQVDRLTEIFEENGVYPRKQKRGQQSDSGSGFTGRDRNLDL